MSILSESMIIIKIRVITTKFCDKRFTLILVEKPKINRIGCPMHEFKTQTRAISTVELSKDSILN